MFEYDKFLKEQKLDVDAVTFTVTDLRTGKKEIGTFYYPTFDQKGLEALCKYGYKIEEIGDRTKASGTINLAGLFANFVGQGGLQ